MDEQDRVGPSTLGRAGPQLLALLGGEVVARVGPDEEVGVTGAVRGSVTGGDVLDAAHRAPRVEG